MTGRRVWIRPGGRVLAHDSDGWPLPAGHVDEVAGIHWLWGRSHVWPCHWTHYTRVCQGLAVWRTADATWRNFYCDTHLPHRRPPDEPSPACRVCGGPMTLAGEAHPGCDDSETDNDAAFDAAHQLVSDETLFSTRVENKPETEAQLRPLTRLVKVGHRDVVGDIWQLAVEAAGGQPSQAQVRAALRLLSDVLDAHELTRTRSRTLRTELLTTANGDRVCASWRRHVSVG